MDVLESTAQARLGLVLRGKWRLERVLGIGGMATVYAATHRNGLRGAVKVLHPEFSRNTDARERFLREGYVANRLARGAVKVLDDDTTEDGSVFLVMELLEGATVEQIASKRPGERMTPREVIDIGLQVLDALRLAHEAGVVHRDIKPENLFLTTTGEVRVLDFGIARLREHAGGSVRATRTQSAMGTPAFMPPEQALARWDEIGPHSDLYSVGATMFTLLTGQLTHTARTGAELLVAVATMQARPLASVLPGIPAGLAAVVDRALAHAPANRFPDAATMRAELELAARSLVAGDIDIDSARTLAVMQAPQAPGSVSTLASSGTPSTSATGSIPLVVAGSSIATGAPVGALDVRSRATTAPVSSDPSTWKKKPRGGAVIASIGVGLAVLSVAGGVIAWRFTRRSTEASSHATTTSTDSAPNVTAPPSSAASERAPSDSAGPAITPASSVAAAPVPSVSAVASAAVSSAPTAVAPLAGQLPLPLPRPPATAVKRPGFDLGRSD